MSMLKPVIAVLLIFTAGAAFSGAETLLIGQADMERVFGEYRGTREFHEDIERIQQEFQEAQAEGNHERLVEIQQEFQIRQNRLIQDFQRDIEAASVPVSEKMKVHVIVAEVLYRAENTEVVDVSDELIEEMK